MQPFMVVTMLLCIAKEVLSKQATFNNILYTEVSSQLFHSLSIVFFCLQIPSTNPQGCPSFSFMYVGDMLHSSQRDTNFLVT